MKGSIRVGIAAIGGAMVLVAAGCTDGGGQLAPDIALKSAVVRGDVDGVREALADGADVDAAPAGVTALHAAARRDDAETVRILLEAGADPDVRAELGDTAAHLSLYEVGTDALAALIEGGADVGMLGGLAYESAPAHYAAVRGNLAALELLEAAGADMRAQTPDGYQPSDQAMCAGRIEVLEWYLARYDDLELVLGRSCAYDRGEDAMVAYIDGLG